MTRWRRVLHFWSLALRPRPSVPWPRSASNATRVHIASARSLPRLLRSAWDRVGSYSFRLTEALHSWKAMTSRSTPPSRRRSMSVATGSHLMSWLYYIADARCVRDGYDAELYDPSVASGTGHGLGRGWFLDSVGSCTFCGAMSESPWSDACTSMLATSTCGLSSCSRRARDM